MPNDKTPPIPLHETWPVVPGPSPPRPMDREPSTTALADHRARTVDLLKIVALAQLARIGFAWARSVDQVTHA